MLCALILIALFLFVLILGVLGALWFWLRQREKEILPNLSSKSVLVTGCDSGFGFDLALRLLQNGIRVFAGCYSEDGRRKLEAEAKELLGALQTIRLDISSQSSVEAAFAQVQRVVDKDEGLWGLVNNAGIKGWSGPDDFLRPEDYLQTFQVNTLGAIRMCQVFKPLVKKAQGRIVNMTSVAGRIAGVGSAAPYCVSKFALEAYSDCLRLEMKPFRVSVHILEPGMFKTPITDTKTGIEDWEKSWQRASEATRKEYGEEYTNKLKELAKLIHGGVSTETHLVIDAYFHALTARFPRRRYWIENTSMQLIASAPTCIQDSIFYKEGYLVPEACKNLPKKD